MNVFSIRTKILFIVLAFLALNGVAFLIYSLITTSNYKMLRLEVIEKTVAYETEKVNRLAADWTTGEVIKALLAIKPTDNSFAKLSVPGKDYIVSAARVDKNSDGINYLRFERYMDNGWLLSIYIPENEILADVEKRNERFSITIVIVSLLMLFIAWLLISKLINSPIKQLITDVSQIALGNLDMQIKISSKDEMGLLADVFNKMTDELKKSIEEKTKEHAEKERINTELNIAGELQASLLPSVFPAFPDRNEFDLYAIIKPAKEVGGDFYDFFFIDDDNLVVVIADVSGKSVPAALFMVIAKTQIKNSSFCKSPASALDSVNKKLCKGNETGMFVTAFIGFYNIKTRKFTFANAGHNPPLIKKKGSSFDFLKTKPNLVLGFKENYKYDDNFIFLEEGDALCLYTDGVTEAMNKTNEFFGEQRLLDAVNKNTELSVTDLLVFIKREVEQFSRETEQADDITMLALRINDSSKNQASGYEKFIVSKEISTLASINNLDHVINFINHELENHNISSVIINEICIAVEEIFINIVNYAYEVDNGEVDISIAVSNEIVIKFEDKGRPYNPLLQPEPDLDKSIAERKIGGLGIFLVKKLMDSAEYSRIGELNVLTITKKYTVD